MILEVARPPVPTPTERADSLVAAFEERLDVRLDRSDIPPIRPAVVSLFFDDEGRLWVHAVTPDDSLRTYDAFDADSGAWLGTLATDLALRDRPSPTIRGDTLWGVMVDELGVPYVVRGRLVKWAAGGSRAGSIR
jgi:hypothetical protein